MKPEHELALIVGYYLSRLDKEGYQKLGYKNFLEAVTRIGETLGVKKNTLKNMRDEFDPFHQNTRVGWKRPLSPSRLKVLSAFQNTDDETLTEIVKEILHNKSFAKTEGYEDIHTLFSDKKSTRGLSGYVVRGITGRAAEAYFIDISEKGTCPIKGSLKDCRDLGCGYDFEVAGDGGISYVEVKGLSGDGGGVVFTNKEWEMARKHGKAYHLALVRNVAATPGLRLIQDPYSKLRPNRSVYGTIQVSWGVSGRDLQQID